MGQAPREVCLDGEKNDRMAFQERAFGITLPPKIMIQATELID